MTVIDAHHHVWDLTVRDQPWLDTPGMDAIRRSFSIDELRPAAAAAGVGATVLVQTVTVAAETPELLALAAADHPGVVAGEQAHRPVGAEHDPVGTEGAQHHVADLGERRGRGFGH